MGFPLLVKGRESLGLLSISAYHDYYASVNIIPIDLRYTEKRVNEKEAVAVLLIT